MKYFTRRSFPIRNFSAIVYVRLAPICSAKDNLVADDPISSFFSIHSISDKPPDFWRILMLAVLVKQRDYGHGPDFTYIH